MFDRDSDNISSLLTTTVSDIFLREGGIISGERLVGGSMPHIFRFISHIERANCSLLSFPLWQRSHRLLLWKKCSREFQAFFKSMYNYRCR